MLAPIETSKQTVKNCIREYNMKNLNAWKEVDIAALPSRKSVTTHSIF